MQVVIEAIADAVSQLILFSVEAEENKARLPQLKKGGEGVRKAVTILIGIGTKMADQWPAGESRADAMRAATAKLDNATNRLKDDSANMADNGYQEKLKLSMMESGRALLGQTIEMLKIADDYDVGQIAKAGKYTENELDGVKGSSNIDSLLDTARGLSHRSLNLIRLAAERVTLLTDYTYKARLEAAITVLRDKHEPLVDAKKKTVGAGAGAGAAAGPNADFVAATAGQLQDAITEVVVVARLSAKHMWDRINLDIAGIRRGKLPPLDQLKDLAKYIDSKLDDMDRAVAARDKTRLPDDVNDLRHAVSQASPIAAMVSDLCDDPQQKKDIMHALDDLETIPDRLQRAADNYVAQPTPQNKAAWDKALQEARKANNDLVEAAIPPDQSLLDALARLNDALNRLRNAARDANAPGAEQARDDALRDIAKELDAGKKLASRIEDPLQKALVADAIDSLNQIPHPLRTAVEEWRKAGGKGADAPNNDALKRLLDAVENARRRAQQLKDLTIPPDQEMADAAAEIAAGLERLKDALHEPDRERAAMELPKVQKNIEAQAERVSHFADSVDDPITKKHFVDDVAELRRLNPMLADVSKQLMHRPRDPQLEAELQDLINRINDCNDRIVRNATDEMERRQNPEEDLLAALERLRRALANLRGATDRNDSAAAVAAVRECASDMSKAPGFAKRIASHLPDDKKRLLANQAADQLQGMVQPLVVGTKATLADPDSAAARKQHHSDIETVERLCERLPQLLDLSPEAQLERAGAELNELLDKYGDAAKAGDAALAGDLGAVVQKKMDEHADRCRRLANVADEPRRRQQLARDADRLAALKPPLMAAGGAVVADCKSAPKRAHLDDIIGQIKDLNSRIAHPPPAFETKADSVLRDLDAIQRGVHKLSAADTDSGLRALRRDLPDCLAEARQVLADKVKDPKQQAALERAIAALEDMGANVIAPACTASLHAPDDRAKLKKVDSVIDEMRALTNELADAELNATREKAIIDNCDLIDKKYGELHASLRDADKDAAARRLAELEDAIRTQAGYARAMSDETQDPLRKAEFRAIGDELDALLPRLADVAKRLMANPNDREAWKDLDAIQKELNALNLRLLQALEGENSDKLERAMEELLAKQARGEDVSQLLKDINLLLKKQALLAKALAARTGDAKRRRDLLDAAKALEKALRDITGSVNANDRPGLVAATNNVYEALSTMKVSANDEIAAAAQAIAAAAAKKKRTLAGFGEGSAAFRLLNGASLIARLMAELSAAAARGDKKAVISLARQIAAAVKDVVTAANEIGKACPDPRLRADLLRFCDPMSNFATQLKILTAVKSATADDDPAYRSQLVTCAQGIASTVVSSTDAAEVCLLRPNKKQ